MIVKNKIFKVVCVKQDIENKLIVGDTYFAWDKGEGVYEGDITAENTPLIKIYAIMSLDNFFIGTFSKDLFELMNDDYDYINPTHYKQGGKETWEKMLEIWGKEAFIKHCEITAFKYIQRLGAKPNNSVEQDLEKARWYLNKAYDLKNNQ